MKISDLPFWAEEYVKHLYTHRPKMYKELRKSKQLEPAALSIQESADALYDRLVEANMARNMSESAATADATNQVMREYILLPSERDVPSLGEEPDEFPEELEE
jgi:Transposon-encoded protein TnpV